MNNIYLGNSLDYYDHWTEPMVIISDGPYGISGYDGYLSKVDDLPKIYEEHIKKWTEKSTSQTTLWFWNTELGWATVHPILLKYGWIYKGCNIWNKGIKHIAGNCNGKTMRKFPVVTEVCIQYVRKEEFINNGQNISLQEWMRNEWKRTGLPFSKANEACGVKNAASRKYLAKDHLWYCPPAKEFQKLVDYANQYGNTKEYPFFVLNGIQMNQSNWEKVRAKFNFEYGVTNVWETPNLKLNEKIKNGNKLIHPNQKPLGLMERIILASSDKGDMIWEPFLGLGSGCLAAKTLSRNYLGAEINKIYFDIAKERLKD